MAFHLSKSTLLGIALPQIITLRPQRRNLECRRNSQNRWRSNLKTTGEIRGSLIMEGKALTDREAKGSMVREVRDSTVDKVLMDKEVKVGDLMEALMAREASTDRAVSMEGSILTIMSSQSTIPTITSILTQASAHLQRSTTTLVQISTWQTLWSNRLQRKSQENSLPMKTLSVFLKTLKKAQSILPLIQLPFRWLSMFQRRNSSQAAR